ncbi:hypothetical protein [Plantactinospora sp. WMMB782]|uniref:hypothetical protein n=1 Tax=Plantactinospora sp. WMMB782 TaxID=3404121 RepID=UPI003B931317
MADVDIDGGGVDMHTEGTETAMAALDQVAADFRQAWAGHRSGMAALESQLGNGPMGREFAALYNPAADGLARSAESTCGRVERRARIGRACVQMYLAADAEGRRGFEG